jgi:hypothetical protein
MEMLDLSPSKMQLDFALTFKSSYRLLLLEDPSIQSIKIGGMSLRQNKFWRQ